MTVVLCCPDIFPLRRIRHCPTCRRRRRFAGYDQAWYGPSLTCCACGDSWACGGERLERPFKPRWRVDAATRARVTWDEAAGLTAADHLTWLRNGLQLDGVHTNAHGD